MSKKLAIKGHETRGKEVIELLEMMGGHATIIKEISNETDKVFFNSDDENCFYRKSIRFIPDSSKEIEEFIVFTLEEFLKKYPFKVGDKVFLYDNITEGCVTGMEWDENKGTVKYCVYTSAEYWCDVKELLKWNAEFLVNKEKSEEVDKMLHDITLSHLHRNHLEVVLSELYEHIKNTPKEELEREYEEIKEWSNVGPTVEEFMTFCECVNKKPVYPKTYDECCKNVLKMVHWGMTVDVPMHYSPLIINFTKLLICRDAYWKIAGEEIGLGKPWEPNWTTFEGMPAIFRFRYNIVCDSIKDYHCLLVFPTKEMRDAFYENFKDLIEQCKELL